jgi:hypothetical protein
MGKRRAGNQTGSLTLDHKKSGIDLFPTSELRVQYVVGKISTRATSLVQTSSRSDFAIGSYELPKSRDSNRDNFGTISGLQLGSPGKKNHLDVVPKCGAENTTWGKVMASPESGPWCVLWSKVPVACPNTQWCSRMWTNHFVVCFGCRIKLDLLVLLPSLIPGLLAGPSTPL